MELEGRVRISVERSKRRGVDEFSINEITVMPHGDSNAWDEIENIGELDMNDWGPEDPDGLETVDDEMQVMDFDPEEVQRMDAKAEEEEISRLKAMPALIELRHHHQDGHHLEEERGERRLVQKSQIGCQAIPLEHRCGGLLRPYCTDGDPEDALAPGSLLPRALRSPGHRC